MTIGDLLANIKTIILEPLAILLFGVSFVIFVFGLVKMIKGAESNDEREKGKRSILWGIVGMVIMVSVYGIINIIIGTIGVDKSKIPAEETKPFLDENAIDSPFD